jgi:hypothetical protein
MSTRPEEQGNTVMQRICGAHLPSTAPKALELVFARKDPRPTTFLSVCAKSWEAGSTLRPKTSGATRLHDLFGAKLRLRPLLDRNHLLTYRHADVLAQRAVKTVVFQLLQHVCAPTGCARHREHRGKEISWNSK